VSLAGADRYDRHVLVGRAEELARVRALLDSARAGRAAALVLRGEPGIGKSTLLEWAAEHADGLRVLRAAGVESEAELPCAGLHQLLRPLLSHLDGLPEPQRRSMRAALALDAGGETDRFAVYLGTLGLLAAGAEAQPTLCLVEDAHWLDTVSAQALTFSARRLEAEPLAMLFAARTGERLFVADGVPELEIARLRDEDSRALLAAPGRPMADATADALVRLAAGNPLALLELPRSLSDEQLRGTAALDDPVPVTGTIESAFLARVRELSAGGRRALVLAAADGSSLLAARLAAASAPGGLEEATRAGLVRVRDGVVHFRHPLVRAAAYQAASDDERRRAHLDLAAALVGDEHADERANHQAAAAIGPDEDVAALLVAAADRAGRRGSPATRARALVRAARLTPEPALRCRRLLDAGTAAFAAGLTALARESVDHAARLTDDPVLRADVAYARWDMQAEAWHELYPSVTAAAEAVAAIDPHRAARMLSYASDYLFEVGRIAEGMAADARAWDLLGHELIPGLLGVPVDITWNWSANERRGEACDLAMRILSVASEHDHPDDFDELAYAAEILIYADDERARHATEALVARARSRGAVSGLCTALTAKGELELRDGRLPAAYAAAREAVTSGELLGGWRLLWASGLLARVAGCLGREDVCRDQARRARELAAEHNRLSRGEIHWALAELALAGGDLERAAGEFERGTALSPEAHPGYPSNGVHTDYAEVLIRLGRNDEAEARLAQLERATAGHPFPRMAAAVRRCRLLTADETQLDGLFHEAAAALDSGWPFEHARTHLVYGERLRRAGRRTDSREALSRALAGFEQLGADAWADHARRELAATGATPRRREVSASDVLTPQELQVALAVAEGRTNREVGAALFISPKTVELHLSRVYRKLGIRSRTDLARLHAVRPEMLARR
jgi:DNA-binding CsgD family transcriptional regulator